MKGQLFCFLFLTGLFSVISRPLAPNIGRPVYLGPTGHQTLETNMKPDQGENGRETERGKERESVFEGVKKLGSSPPSCEHKCFGCIPCKAIQVPTTKGHVGVQYANYEPEGWKCKCGPTFYTP